MFYCRKANSAFLKHANVLLLILLCDVSLKWSDDECSQGSSWLCFHPAAGLKLTGRTENLWFIQSHIIEISRKCLSALNTWLVKCQPQVTHAHTHTHARKKEGVFFHLFVWTLRRRVWLDHLQRKQCDSDVPVRL